MQTYTARQARERGLLILSAVLLALAVVVNIPASVAGDLSLRAHDAIGPPGGTIAVVIRTYASRPIGQGQLCMQAAARVPGQSPAPIDLLISSRVFSIAGDVVLNLSGDLLIEPQQIVVQFDSVSATVNAADGPMAVFFLQLDPNLQPGDEYELVVDVPGSSLTDEFGVTVPIRPRNGLLTIRAAGDPIAVSAHAETTIPGGVTRMSMVTFEPIHLKNGQVGFRYDPAMAAGPPVVSMDPRHGNATFISSTPTPGLVLVHFDSPDGTLNDVPGDIVEISLPTSASVAPGTQSVLSLDPLLTFLNDASGQVIPLDLKPGVLEFTSPLPGEVSELSIEKLPDGTLLLDWLPGCGSGTAHAVYRGDLALGYDSLVFEPGYCNVSPTSTIIAAGVGEADFFLVVPHYEGQEGSYGIGALDEERSPAALACFVQADSNPCAP